MFNHKPFFLILQLWYTLHLFSTCDVYIKLILTFGCNWLGWGHTTTPGKYGKSLCYTNEFGPAPHTLCSFPFSYKGHVFSDCIKTDVPSSRNPVCRNFFKWANKVKLKSEEKNLDSSYSIEYPSFKTGRRRVHHVRCYNPGVIDHGWCGTCYDFLGDSIQKNDEGYCSTNRKGI